MELKLFSGEYRSDSYTNRLKRVCELSDSGIQAFVDLLRRVASKKKWSEETLAELKEIVGAKDEDDARGIGNTAFSSILRILSGKANEETQKDLIDHGFDERGVRKLFALTTALPKPDRENLMSLATVIETTDERNHIHAISTAPSILFVTDAGLAICSTPISVVKLRIWMKDTRKETVWRLESTYDELDFLIHALQGAKAELETAAKAFKSRLGDIMADPTHNTTGQT